MSKDKEKNCRLCLETVHDDYTAIEEIIRDIFKVLLLKVDLSVSEEPVLCNGCMESIQEAFDFKSSCIAVEKLVASLAVDRNSAELDIRDVYLNENENKSYVFNEDYNICRFCLQCLEKSNFTLLNDLKKSVTEEMLLKCIPELHLNIIKDPMVCVACMKSLERYYIFTTKCGNIEENIKKYSEVHGVECNEQINLSDVQKILFKIKQECTGNFDVTLKEEDNLCPKEEEFDMNNVLKIEKEELVIKDENQYLDCEIENDRCGETKWKEVVRYDKLIHKDSSEKDKLIHKGKAKGTVYKCNSCSFETKWKSALRNHMLIHKDLSDGIMYKCEKCTFETKHERYLKRHMFIHKDNSEVTMYKCDFCSYETKWRHYIKKHVLLIHKDSSDVVLYRCEMCTFKTKYKCNLKLHMLNHKNNSEVTMHKCNLCSYETKLKVYLKRHMLTHMGVLYYCELCMYKTKSKRHFTLHMGIHEGKLQLTPHKCNLRTYEAKKKSS